MDKGKDKNKNSDYEVGYKKTPKHTRFKKGQSGNPGGRKKGAKGLKAELDAELNERVSVTVNGKTKRISKRRLVIAALTARAIKGHVVAADKVLALAVQANGWEEKNNAKVQLSKTEQAILDEFLAEDTDSDAGISSNDIGSSDVESS